VHCDQHRSDGARTAITRRIVESTDWCAVGLEVYRQRPKHAQGSWPISRLKASPVVGRRCFPRCPQPNASPCSRRTQAVAGTGDAQPHLITYVVQRPRAAVAIPRTPQLRHTVPNLPIASCGARARALRSAFINAAVLAPAAGAQFGGGSRTGGGGWHPGGRRIALPEIAAGTDSNHRRGEHALT
jgi:hypothetical protein